MHPQTLRIYERKGLVDPAAHQRRQPPLLRRRHRACSAASPSSPTRVSTWPGSSGCWSSRPRSRRLRAELAEARRAVGEAVESTHRQYRRDLVPLRQEVTVFGRIDLPDRS